MGVGKSPSGAANAGPLDDTLQGSGRARLHDADPFAALRGLKGRVASECDLVVEGEITALRFLQSGWPVDAVALTPGKLERLAPYLRAGVRVFTHSAQELSELVGFPMHRGVIACGPMPSLEQPPLLSPEKPRTVVLAAGLADPRNVGALIRNARALGADALVCDPAGADPLSRQAVRAAMGHGFTLPLWRETPVAALQHLRRALPGLQVVAASASPSACPVQTHPWGHHVALLVGHEGEGLSAELLAEADAHVTIPMAPDVDSLNVAGATAILLHARSCFKPPAAGE